ncbi:MAG TPA: hypothetical protein VHY91_23470 [Pirellulales bacterium]|jgi:hypothetical protein|nr:hypothetical protein [Pirellulales bacterium]
MTVIDQSQRPRLKPKKAIKGRDHDAKPTQATQHRKLSVWLGYFLDVTWKLAWRLKEVGGAVALVLTLVKIFGAYQTIQIERQKSQPTPGVVAKARGVNSLGAAQAEFTFQNLGETSANNLAIIVDTWCSPSAESTEVPKSGVVRTEAFHRVLASGRTFPLTCRATERFGKDVLHARVIEQYTDGFGTLFEYEFYFASRDGRRSNGEMIEVAPPGHNSGKSR